MIKIQPSETADTRTCDVSKVTREQLKKSSYQHIADVRAALAYFQKKIQEAGERHDFTKLEGLDQFYSDFRTGFKTTIWWDEHRLKERHHIGQPDGVRDDIDLVDVLEFIADCVMAGMGRSGSVYDLKLDDAVLQKAFKNTTDKLKAQVMVDK